MNKARRTALKVIVNKLWEMDAIREQVCEALEQIIDQEHKAYDNMPEHLQESEQGHKIEDYIDTMELALGDLSIMMDGITDNLAEICEEV
jgi:archaellum component FlaC